jgi:integrase
MALGAAVARFWEEKGQYEANSASVWYQLENLVDGLGEHKPLSAISMSDLAEYQARRRGQKNRHGRLPANRTINAEMPELLARIYRRAEEVWSDGEGGRRIDTGSPKKWAQLKLRVPKERVRELQPVEEAKLAEHLRDDYADIVQFAIASGLRRAQLILTWPQCDFDARVIHYQRKSIAGDDWAQLPMTDRIWQILQAQRGRHRTYVFTYVAEKTRDGRKRGKRYPITIEGLKTEMRRSVDDAGITNWRVIHDLRHTAATRTLRASNNLKAVQGQLGHADIASTAKYAHAMLDDIRAAMDAAAPSKPPVLVAVESTKAKGKK